MTNAVHQSNTVKYKRGDALKQADPPSTSPKGNAENIENNIKKMSGLTTTLVNSGDLPTSKMDDSSPLSVVEGVRHAISQSSILNGEGDGNFADPQEARKISAASSDPSLCGDRKGSGTRRRSSQLSAASDSSAHIFKIPKRVKEFRIQFHEIPDEEELVDNYSCAFQREILVQGRMYLSMNYFAFHANILGWETSLVIPLKDIIKIKKEKTVKLIPNAIQIFTDANKYTFASLLQRDTTFSKLEKCWNNALTDNPLDFYSLFPGEKRKFSLDYLKEDDDSAASSTVGVDGLAGSPKSEYANRVGKAFSSAQLISESGPITHHGTLDVNHHRYSVDGSHEDLERISTQRKKEKKLKKLFRKKTSRKEIVSEKDDDADALSFSDSENTFDDSAYERNEEEETSHNQHKVVACDEVFNTTVEKLFWVLYNKESNFPLSFLKGRNVQLVKVGDWLEPDKEAEWITEIENGIHIKRRKVEKIVPIKKSFGPKTALATEIQVLVEDKTYSKVIDCEVFTPTVPYGDTFTTVSRVIITHAGSGKVRMRISCKVVYKKSCMGIIKNFIEKHAFEALKDVYSEQAKALKDQFSSVKEKASSQPTPSRKTGEELPEMSSPISDAAAEDQGKLVLIAFWIAKLVVKPSVIITFLAFLLLVSNALLFSRLFALESGLGGSVQHFDFSGDDANLDERTYQALYFQQKEQLRELQTVFERLQKSIDHSRSIMNSVSVDGHVHQSEAEGKAKYFRNPSS
eukprot:Nk52_evm82s1073 gene=Nk52_evmTU82s1073